MRHGPVSKAIVLAVVCDGLEVISATLEILCESPYTRANKYISFDSVLVTSFGP